MRRVHTFCRICEPHCALLAEVDDDRIRLLPDPGTPCIAASHATRG